MKLTKILTAGIAAAAVASAFAVTAAAENAYIGFQTTLYSFRNAQDDGTYGKATDYFNNFIVWGSGDSPETTFPDYEDNFDYDVGGYLLPATYEDAAISGDGTYTVTAKDLDWALDGASDFNLVFVSTDIPIDAGVTCTEAKIIVDGEVVKTVENPICDDTQKNFNISLANTWNSDIGGYGLAFPTESLAVEFTLTGLGAAAADAAPADAAPADAAPADAAPAAGDVDAATDSSKGSPDTGVEDVAVIGGLALLAGAAIAVTRKRK